MVLCQTTSSEAVQYQTSKPAFTDMADAFRHENLDSMPDAPTAAQRKANPYHAAVEAVYGIGNSVRAVLETVKGYTFTALASGSGSAVDGR
ncbi:hypothetical protein LTR85_011471 [Meristemomyces frigidus]|nr:hypothetical protein LTR85_011471 [Meristemomyces frigidus]